MYNKRMSNYKNLSKEIENLIENNKLNGSMPKFYCADESVIRRKDNGHDKANIWRTAFIRDIDKIINKRNELKIEGGIVADVYSC